MGKYFGSELTSSKADIYNKSSIVSHPDNYSVNGLKQTWAWNRHIVGFCCSLDLCVKAHVELEIRGAARAEPSFHGTGPSTCYAPGSVTRIRHHSSPAQNMPVPFLSPKKTPKPLTRLAGPRDLAPLTSPSQLLAFPPFTPFAPQICYKD